MFLNTKLIKSLRRSIYFKCQKNEMCLLEYLRQVLKMQVSEKTPLLPCLHRNLKVGNKGNETSCDIYSSPGLSFFKW